MKANLLGVQYHMPSPVCTNEDLVAVNPSWDAAKIFQKTGILQRHVTGSEETASDLAYAAAKKLFAELAFDPVAVDALLFCTQSPDYLLPTTACILQDRLKLPTTCGAMDYNLGCSGFTYGLWLARSMILSGSATNVLLVMAETYSKYCDIHDMATATIFGDAAAAALVSSSAEGALAEIGPTVVGTDGRGWKNLIVRAGAARCPRCSTESPADAKQQKDEHLFMNGPEIFRFTLESVRAAIQRLLDRSAIGWDDVDLFLMHQANRFMLESLRDTMKIPPEKMPIDMADCGNTVSASIPVLMRRCFDRGILKSGQKCVLAGFGVGYSWAMTELKWLATKT